MSVDALYMEIKDMFSDEYEGCNLESIECSCGGIASPNFIDKVYRFGGKTITVKDVPVLKCEVCNQMFSDFIVDIRTEEQAAKAMNEGKNEIEF